MASLPIVGHRSVSDSMLPVDDGELNRTRDDCLRLAQTVIPARFHLGIVDLVVGALYHAQFDFSILDRSSATANVLSFDPWHLFG